MNESGFCVLAKRGWVALKREEGRFRVEMGETVGGGMGGEGYIGENIRGDT